MRSLDFGVAAAAQVLDESEYMLAFPPEAYNAAFVMKLFRNDVQQKAG